MDDLGRVLEEVLDVSPHWYPLGVQLQVRISMLDNIQAQFPDPKRQLLEMLKVWLTTSDNTNWKSLIDALASRSVGASQLASVLERKHCVMKESEEDDGTSTIIEYGTSTSDSQPETNLTALLVSEQMVPIQQPGVVHIQESK